MQNCAWDRSAKRWQNEAETEKRVFKNAFSASAIFTTLPYVDATAAAATKRVLPHLSVSRFLHPQKKKIKVCASNWRLFLTFAGGKRTCVRDGIFFDINRVSPRWAAMAILALEL